jgi:hypothetical protein
LWKVLIASLGGVVLSAWIAAVLKGMKGGASVLFLAVFVGGLAAGFLATQSLFRLGRRRKLGDAEPAPPSPPSANLVWESIKTLWGFWMFFLKLLVGALLWGLCFAGFVRLGA